jgi:Uma2 family endonuclease
MAAIAVPSPRPAAPKITVEEYLERERRATVRHEYVDGEVLEMPGETPTHNEIAGNIYRKLGNNFEARACKVYMEGIRVRVTPTRYRYPDVVALCGQAQFDSDNPPALLNPFVIFEVLSPSTEEFDKDENFVEYRQVASLTDYVLVAQDEALVIHYTRTAPNRWALTEYTDLSDAFMLASLEVTLALTDVYRQIVF